jgi:hypothetical protein
MSDSKTNMLGFLELSEYLTGFNKADLLGTGMLEVYFNTFASNVDQAAAQTFWQQVNAILAESKGKEDKALSLIRERLIGKDSGMTLPQQIILLWYTGSWTDGQGNTRIISSEAYRQSLLWPAITAHVPGAKQPGFGSWSLSPDEFQTK